MYQVDFENRLCLRLAHLIKRIVCWSGYLNAKMQFENHTLHVSTGSSFLVLSLL